MEKNRKEKKNFYSGIVIIILLFIAISVSYIKSNSSENHTNPKSHIDSISGNDTTAWIKETYKVKMGNLVTYIFSNLSGEGVLTVEGKGAIKDEENSFLATKGITISEEREYFINTIDMDTSTEKEDNYNLKELELLEVIKMGEDIEYQLYNNGLLVVSGSGVTYSFHSEADLYNYFKEHICCMTKNEVRERWFNQIKYVFINTNITEIGDYALSNMWYVEEIVAMSKLEKSRKKRF